MSEYLEINNIQSILDNDVVKEFIIPKVLDDGTITLCYHILNFSIFTNKEIIECRGLSYDPNTLKVVLRPYHKFFNLNDGYAISTDSLKEIMSNNHCNKYRVAEKLDGSMVAMSYIDGKLYTHFKRSLFPYLVYDNVKEFVKDISEKLGDVTCIYEYLYNSFQSELTVYYKLKQSKFVLLDVRDNKTGKYYNVNDYIECASKHGVEVVQYKLLTYDELMYHKNHAINHEGYVINTNIPNNEKIKFKTDWYNEQCGYVGMINTPFKIIKLILSGEIDDVMPILNEHLISDMMNIVNDFIKKFNYDFNTYSNIVMDNIKPFLDMDMKSIATSKETNNFHIVFSSLFKANKEENYYKMLKKVFLSNFKSEYLEFNSRPNIIELTNNLFAIK